MLKAMLLYRILDPLHIKLLNDWERLADTLAECPAKQPTGSQWGTRGFDKPSPTFSDQLVWSGEGDSTLFTVYFHERQLTGANIRDHLLERIHKVESREQRSCYRKEIAQMKDEVIAELLPKAFIKHSAVQMIVKGNLLIVGTSSAKRAEDCLATLREAIGSLSVRPFTTKLAPELWLTDLMRSAVTSDLKLLDSAKLTNSVKDVVTFKGVDLTDDEPQAYLGQGFHVAALALNLLDEFYFVVTDQLIFKSMKFSDILMDRVLDDSQGDGAAIIDGNLILILDAVDKLIEAITALSEEELPVRKEDHLANLDIVAEAASLIRTAGRASVALIMRNTGCTDRQAQHALDELTDAGLLEYRDKGYHIKQTGYTAPEQAEAEDSLQEAVKGILAPIKNGGSLSVNGETVLALDEFGDPIPHPANLADQEDEDL